jgi:hypothetical protein
VRAALVCLHLLLLAAAQAATATATAAADAPPRRAATNRESDRYHAWRTAVVGALVKRGDAQSLATAAALQFGAPAAGVQTQGLQLAARAAALAPEDPAIAWLHLRLCAGAVNCDFRGAATDMRWLDADNAAAWLPTLSAAYRSDDTTELERVLMDMAETARFELYRGRIVVFMFSALQAAEKALPSRLQSADAARLALAEEVAGAASVPPFGALVDACRAAAAGSERRENCLRVAKLMQQSDTTPAQVAGLGIERRTLPADSREARALLERRRLLEWRSATAAQFDAPLLPWLRNAHARWRLARMRSLHRDEDVAVAILRKQGLPTEPPKEPR